MLLGFGQVRKLLGMPDVIRAVGQVFRMHGMKKVQMPAKIYLHLDKYEGDFRAMPSYIEGLEACGLKWVNVHPKNSRFGLPSVMAVIIYSDPKTGFPLCIMEGTLITNLRTGAAGAVAARALARKNSRTVGLVGCGVQARTQLLALKELFKIKSAAVWGTKLEYAIDFARDMASLGLHLEIKKDIRDCVRDKDIVVTATPARKPIVKSGWISPGTHINAIGADAPGKEELEPAILRKAKIFVDDRAQACHSGEINVPLSKGLISAKDIRATLGEVLAGKKNGRVNDREITVFDSTGLAIQDVACAHFAYKKAIKKHKGRWIKL